MLLLVILIISVGGILSQEEVERPNPPDVFKECANLITGDLLAFDHVPESEELVEKCPDEIVFFGCLSQKMEEDESMPRSLVSVVKSVHELFKEICDEDTDMYKGYISSVVCYKIMEDEAETCFEGAKDVYKAHHALINHEVPHDVDGDWIQIDAMCMVQSVTVACLSKKVMDICDELAYTTLMEIVRKSQYLHQYCSPTVKNVLQTSILSSLDADEPTRNAYRDLFDIIKK